MRIFNRGSVLCRWQTKTVWVYVKLQHLRLKTPIPSLCKVFVFDLLVTNLPCPFFQILSSVPVFDLYSVVSLSLSVCVSQTPTSYFRNRHSVKIKKETGRDHFCVQLITTSVLVLLSSLSPFVWHSCLTYFWFYKYVHVIISYLYTHERKFLYRSITLPLLTPLIKGGKRPSSYSRLLV